MNPRPYVLIGPPLYPDQGFTDAASKLALSRGVVEGAASQVEEPVRIMRRFGQMGLGVKATPSPLLVTRADRTSARFRTDRGLREFTAWRVEANGSVGPIWVLDERSLDMCWFPAEALSHPAVGAPRIDRAATGGDLGSLAVRFTGSRQGAMDYRGVAVESASAVCVVLSACPAGQPPSSGSAMRAVGSEREVIVRLRAPLGGRVLVNLDGGAVEVLEG